MKKRILLVLLAVVLVVSLVAFAACAKEEEVVPEEWQWPERLLITTLQAVGPTYASVVAWTTPLAKDTGMAVRIVCETSIQVGQQWVKEGRFFATSPHQIRSMLYGSTGWANRDGGPWQSRIFSSAGRVYWSFSVLGDSGIKTPHDIKPGMGIACMTIAEEPKQMMTGLLAWAQVDLEDVTIVPVSVGKTQARLLMDGKVDVALCYLTAPYWFEVEASPHGLGVLELDWQKDPEGAQRFLDWYPYTAFGMAKGSPLTFAEGLPVAETLIPNITSAGSDTELVYRVVKWLDENYDTFKGGAPFAADMTLANLIKLAESHYEPLHDGAVRYLEEKGLWTEELEARRQYNIEQLTLLVEAYQAAIVMADDRGILVDIASEEWTELWENYKESQNLPLLVNFQGPGKEQPGYSAYYEEWNQLDELYFK